MKFEIGKKGYLEISFGWLFALIVGAFILFLAIYFSIKLIGIGQQESDLKTGKGLGIILSPLEIGSESVKSNYLDFPVETRIYATCSEDGNFGKQLIKISQKSFNKWTDTDERVGFLNKYLFAEEPIEGKKFYVFSKPFDFPFKVADIMVLTSDKKTYCFKDAPEDIERELTNINQKNFLVNNCTGNSIKVCFGAGSCDIKVSYNEEDSEKESSGYVEKNGEVIYFIGDALMYGAIFADKEIYECQIKRLMKRTEMLAKLYEDKASFVSRVDCNSALELTALANQAKSLEKSNDFNRIYLIVKNIDEENELALCKLW